MNKLILLLLFFFVFPSVSHAQEAKSNTERIKFGNPKTLAGGACWPTTGRVSQGPQGGTSHNGIFQGSGDESLDISALPYGTNPPVYATFNGSVKTYDCTGSGNCVGGYGNMIQLTPDQNSASRILHGHLSLISVADGSSVSQGEQIGIMGTTGASTGVHLHWEFEGIPLAPPYIPEEIPIPKRTCDSEVDCAISMSASPDSCLVSTSTPTEALWFVLHRKSNTEDLYKGPPGNKVASTLQKTFQVKTGRPGERPTPLPQLIEREYWTIIEGHPESSNPETAPYFLTLDIPGIEQPPYGPVPYTECNGSQCDWVTAGAFGLHGVGGNPSKLSSSDVGSSGCIRHSDDDITYLYNLLDFSGGGIRYYVEDN